MRAFKADELKAKIDALRESMREDQRLHFNFIRAAGEHFDRMKGEIDELKATVKELVERSNENPWQK